MRKRELSVINYLRTEPGRPLGKANQCSRRFREAGTNRILSDFVSYEDYQTLRKIIPLHNLVSGTLEATLNKIRGADDSRTR